MYLSRGTRWFLRIGTGITLAFIYLPLIIIALYAFNSRRTQTWPIPGLTFDWFVKAWHNHGARDALLTSVKAGLAATAIALILGSLAAAAVSRFRFFGRESISFLVILPIALPGIVTGMALGTTFRTFGIDLGLATVIVGHATFCVVLAYNNVVARLRRTSGSLIEASQDLGADGWQTFRFVLWPVLSTALVAGGLLAFALSFDEVIVTTFTAGAQETLPLYILHQIERGQDLPVVNVVAFFVIAITVIPVALAQRVMRDTGVIRRGAAQVTEAVEAAEIPAV
jgi:putative spermidine/putrescine transport system permease protein